MARLAPPSLATAFALRLAFAFALAVPSRGAGTEPAAPRTFAVVPGSVLAYHVEHKLHSVDGTSRSVEGRARLVPDGAGSLTVQAMVRARVDSFDSGNGNRDAHMREVTEAVRHPFVTVKAVGSLPAADAYPAEAEVVLRGEVDLHGRTRPVEIPITVRWESADRARVEGAFAVSLEAHEVERPSLLFVKVEDRLDVRATLVLEAER